MKSSWEYWDWECPFLSLCVFFIMKRCNKKLFRMNSFVYFIGTEKTWNDPGDLECIMITCIIKWKTLSQNPCYTMNSLRDTTMYISPWPSKLMSWSRKYDIHMDLGIAPLPNSLTSHLIPALFPSQLSCHLFLNIISTASLLVPVFSFHSPAWFHFPCHST